VAREGGRMKTYLIKATYIAEVEVIKEVRAESEEEAKELEAEGAWFGCGTSVVLNDTDRGSFLIVTDYKEGPLYQEITEKK
jgi:hypothetical protein